jgi:hypothetical protein
MKRLVLAALAASSLAMAVTPALAQSWQPINQRQAAIDARIDEGVRNGALTRGEAARLRTDFRSIVSLEARYRVSGGGLSAWERTDLDHRLDALSRRVYVQKHDRDVAAGWLTINQRQAELDARIDQGVRNGALTRAEAISLRGQFRTIANLEAYYRRTGGGLTAAERADLDRRMDALNAHIYIQKHDRQRR